MPVFEVLGVPVLQAEGGPTALSDDSPMPIVACCVKNADLYPRMLDLLAGDTQPTLADPVSQAHYVAQLKALRREPADIELARQPLSSVLHDPVARARRREVLELARLWFTAELHGSVQPEGGEPTRLALKLAAEYKDCEDCSGVGTLTVGKFSKQVTCPTCNGQKRHKVESPWKL